MNYSAPFNQIIKDLKNEDVAVRRAAIEKLEKMKTEVDELNIQAGIRLLQAAASNLPTSLNWNEDGSDALIRYIAEFPHIDYVYVIEQFFSGLSPLAKESVFVLLSRIATEESARTVLRLLRRENIQNEISVLPIEEFRYHGELGKILFPELLKSTVHLNLCYSIYFVLVHYLRDGNVDESTLEFQKDLILKDYIRLKEVLLPIQDDFSPEVSRLASYKHVRLIASLYLDIMGFVDGADIDDELFMAFEYKDTRLKHYAALSLLRKGYDVSSEIIEEIVKEPEMRNYMYKELVFLGKLSLFPEKYMTQELIAESNLVNWLSYQNELGNMPDEIEFVEAFMERDEEGEFWDYYLFKFRSSDDQWKDFGWMAGMSGPYLRKSGLSLDAMGSTLSDYQVWDDKTPSEHFMHLLKTSKDFWNF